MYGSKIDNLIKLRDSGFNVPAFTVVPYEDAVREDLEVKLPSSGKLFSVRSSANVEDGEFQSFAGQFDTFLNVPEDEVSGKIKDIINTLNSDSVKAYAESKNISITDIRMNIIVQDMIDSEVSGVLFTANPQGILNESVITVGRGLGEGVVSSKVDTTSYYYNLTDKICYFEGKEDLLSPEKIDELIGTAEGIKKIFGEYLDIEFAIENGSIFILQVRPITTLKTDDPLIMDNSNIVESYPGISSPLTTSFVDLVYSGVFRGLSARVLKNDKELSKHEDIFLNMTGHVNGRVYYKISNWYTVIKFLPMSKKIIPVWQEMMGVRNKAYNDDDVKIGFFMRIATYFNSIYELCAVPKNMRKLNEKFIVINDDFYKKFDPSLPPSELVSLFNDVKARLFDCWDVTLLNDMYSFIFTGLLKSRMKKKYGKDDKEINEYISGISDIESMKPVIEITRLALQKDEMTAEEFEAAKKEYIRRFGDRNLEELKLESRTFRSNPELLDWRINQYRKDMVRLKETWESFNRKKETEDKYDALTRFYVKKASLGIYNREISRLNRSRIYGIVRLIVDSLGAKYKEQGLIGKAHDIYYMKIDEALDLASSPRDMSKIISERKDQYKLYRELPPYSRLIFAEGPFNKRHTNVNSYHKRFSDNELSGIPCSGGIAEGEALVITDVEDTGDVKDKILITKMTDPGWVFLLTQAKGVISEKGSLLSHTAIISREIGIPSIVGVKDLMDTIRTGDLIRMNGDKGKIEILKRSGDT
ncbi:MAG: phosphoenolpyruvate synthase [Saccharofermentans sp.]|nr:phosphoenolpyruvate synthase [Saccharofermentans sp.]